MGNNEINHLEAHKRNPWPYYTLLACLYFEYHYDHLILFLFGIPFVDHLGTGAATRAFMF
jgi:hypothetical protein